MKFYKLDAKKKIVLLIMLPIFITAAIVIGRKIVMPTNEEIVNELKSTKMYTCDVEYTFINSKDKFVEVTKQYYRDDKGGRIEFDDYYKRVKVYQGNEIKLQANNKEYFIDNDLDCIYPLAFLKNLLSCNYEGPIEELKEEWGENKYLKLNIKYGEKNRYLNTAEFYIDKNKRVPVVLKIFDESGNERIIIKYSNYKCEKIINAGLF